MIRLLYVKLLVVRIDNITPKKARQNGPTETRVVFSFELMLSSTALCYHQERGRPQGIPHA
eukprot:4745350-Pyramimonas_sp.AAC.1